MNYYYYVWFYRSSYSDFFNSNILVISSHIVCISILGLLNRSLKPNICADSSWRLILRYFSLSIILTSSHKSRWFPFSFHIWSAIPDFSISPTTTAFRCSSSLNFSRQHVSPLYTLAQLQGMEYTKFLVMLNSVKAWHEEIRGSFQTFFVWALLLIVHVKL